MTYLKKVNWLGAILGVAWMVTGAVVISVDTPVSCAILVLGVALIDEAMTL